MAYSGVYVFGDSLVDAGNALKLAEAYDYFPFTSLPNGAPTSAKGYHSGNFTNGWTFADLISNKYLGVTTKSVFPFGYDDPFLGISFGFFSDPNGNNLNFAYGGAQIRQGDEAVPDMDDQTDAYRDAVDGDADPNALHMFVFGANDLHDLVPRTGAWADEATAREALQRAANEYIEEVRQTIEIGAEHILLIGVPDIGIQPDYNGTADEAARRAVATEYAQMLDEMIRAQLDELATPGVEIHYVSFADIAEFVIGTMVALYGEAEIYPLNLSDEVFFDRVHPTTQVHALTAAYLLDLLSDTPAGERMPLTAPNYSSSGIIAATGEVDTITISLAANTSYTFELLGLSTLGGDISILADPMLVIFGPNGTLLGSNDDGGVGLDASFVFTSGAAGDYTIQLSGVGVMTGYYLFQAAGQAMGNNSYVVSHSGAIILEQVGGGSDTVRTSVSYALNAGAEIEVLRTSNDRGKTAINLTGNEFGQTIIGNSASNVIEGKAGADVMTGGAGKDTFILSNAAVINPGAANIDRITDYSAGEVVDISQILSVASGTNVISGGFVRVTTSGLIQVDVDGGGNNWVTLSSINGGGAVTIRYLAGGVSTNLSVSRVSASSSVATASAVAAAGLAAEPATTDHAAVNDGSLAAAVVPWGSGGKHLWQSEDAFASFGPRSESPRSVDHGESDGATHHRGAFPLHELDVVVVDGLGGAVPIETPAAASTPAQGDPVAAVHVLAQSVAMPSAKMLAASEEQAKQPALELDGSVIEALADNASTIDSLLLELPGFDAPAEMAQVPLIKQGPAGWADIAVIDAAHASLIIDAASQHPDAPAMV